MKSRSTSKKIGRAIPPYSRRVKPLTALDAYLIAERLTNASFAERVRAARGHPCGPTHVTVSTWRRGCAVPAHDTRAIIEVVTAGRVAFKDWSMCRDD